MSWVGSLGYDYKELVRRIIEAERRPILLLQARQATLDKVRAAWTEVKTRLSNLDAKLSSLKLDSTFQARKVTSSGAGVVTGTATTAAALGSYSVTVVRLATAHMAYSDAQAAAWTLSASDVNGDGKLSFTLNGVEVQVANGDTLAAVRDKINAAFQANPSATQLVASVVDNQLVLKAAATGKANAITMTADPDGILAAIGVWDATAGAFKHEPVRAGDVDAHGHWLLDAELTVDGLTVTRAKNTVDDVLGGVTLTLVGAGSATVTVERDVQQAVDAVKAFVDQVNSVLGFLGQKTQSGGELFGDPTAARLERTLRARMGAIVSGLATYDSLDEIGVKPSGEGVDAARSGLYYVDETKLRDALANDANAVKELFYASSTSINGVGELLESDLDLYLLVDGIIPSKEAMLNKQRNLLDKQIGRLEEMLAQREKRLLQQFQAAEQMVALLQAQGQYLMARLGIGA